MLTTALRVAIVLALANSVATSVLAEETARAFDPGVARRITTQEVQRRRDKGEKPVFVDTRSTLADAVVRGAVHVPNGRLETWAKDVPKGALIVAYCT